MARTRNLKDLPFLDASDFDPSYDYIIIQQKDGQTYKARASIFGQKASAGAKFIDKSIVMAESSGNIGQTAYSISNFSTSAHTAIISVRQKGSSNPVCNFTYYTRSDYSISNALNLQHSGTSQWIQDMIFIPVVNGSIYFSLTESGGTDNYVFLHGYIG